MHRVRVLLSRVAHPTALPARNSLIRQGRAGTEWHSDILHDALTAGPAARQPCSRRGGSTGARTCGGASGPPSTGSKRGARTRPSAQPRHARGGGRHRNRSAAGRRKRVGRLGESRHLRQSARCSPRNWSAARGSSELAARRPPDGRGKATVRLTSFISQLVHAAKTLAKAPVGREP